MEFDSVILQFQASTQLGSFFSNRRHSRTQSGAKYGIELAIQIRTLTIHRAHHSTPSLQSPSISHSVANSIL